MNRTKLGMTNHNNNHHHGHHAGAASSLRANVSSAVAAVQAHHSKLKNNTKDHTGGKKGLLLSADNLSSLNSSIFDLPAALSGMKNIEHYIDKSMVEGKQWYRCKWNSCHYNTIRSDSIVRHMRKHTGERPYKCWFCSYATIQSSALKIHMRRHTGEKPYVCKFENCGKSFAVLNTLSVHERTHTGYKPYKCSFAGCAYTGNDRSKLILHLRKTHGMDVNGHETPNAASSLKTNLFNGTREISVVAPPVPSNASSSHSLALVSGSQSLLMSSVYHHPFTPTTNSASHHPPMTNTINPLKSPPASTTVASAAGHSAFSVPLNLLSVFGGAASYENLQNETTSSLLGSSSLLSGYSHPPSSQHHQPHPPTKSNTTRVVKRKPALSKPIPPPAMVPAFPQHQQYYQQQQQQQANNGFSAHSHNERTNSAHNNKKTSKVNSNSAAIALTVSNGDSAQNVSRQENSINRVMEMVRKTIVGNHSIYCCKWANCTYKTQRSDTIVRHIRSHTGEKPYRCGQCSYATIQRCTLNKHLLKHQNQYNSALGTVVNNFC